MRTFLVASLSIALLACGSGGGSSGAGGSTANGSGGSNAGGANAGGASANGGGHQGGGGGSAPADTWNNYAKNFFATYCVSCHNTNDPQGLDFEQFTIVKQNAATIRCGVAPMQESGCGSSPLPKQFPVGGGPKPSDAERARIVAWIDAGTPQ